MAASSTTGLPISSLIYKPPSTITPAVSAATQLGPDAFLKLLTTQLKNQNPLTPMDDTQSIAQLAQFSATQATTDLKTAFGQFESNFALMQSASLIGKHVQVSSPNSTGPASTIVGTVAGVTVINGQPQIALDDAGGKLMVDTQGNALQFPTSSILTIGG